MLTPNSANQAWVGLEGSYLDVVSNPITCQDAGCNGLIDWADGTKFTYEPWMVSLDFRQRNGTTNLRTAINDKGELISIEIEKERRGVCQCEKSRLYHTLYIRLGTTDDAHLNQYTEWN